MLYQINGLVKERCNSSALAMELRLSSTNPSKCEFNWFHFLWGKSSFHEKFSSGINHYFVNPYIIGLKKYIFNCFVILGNIYPISALKSFILSLSSLFHSCCDVAGSSSQNPYAWYLYHSLLKYIFMYTHWVNILSLMSILYDQNMPPHPAPDQDRNRIPL